jgi:uncharacterized cupredoxin-like copper-binding protein
MSRRITLAGILAAVVVALAAAVAVAAGGGGGGSGGGGGGMAASMAMTGGAARQGEVVNVMASPHGRLRFTMTQATVARPGKVTLRMTNPSSAGIEHGIAIEGHGVDRDGPIVAPGKTSTVTVTLKKGTYTYYCPVPGHEQAGMKGTLTVR